METASVSEGQKEEQIKTHDNFVILFARLTTSKTANDLSSSDPCSRKPADEVH